MVFPFGRFFFFRLSLRIHCGDWEVHIWKVANAEFKNTFEVQRAERWPGFHCTTADCATPFRHIFCESDSRLAEYFTQQGDSFEKLKKTKTKKPQT